MAEQIIQTLGFDAGDALTTIRALTTELGTFNAQLQKVAQSAQLFNKNKLSSGLNRTAKSSKTYAKNMGEAAKKTKKAGTAVKKTGQQVDGANAALNQSVDSVKKFSISFDTLTKIVATQVIIRTFNAIKDSISESVTEVRELQKRIGEIQTIAGGALGDNLQLEDSLNVTAQTFGFDILDVAEAKYQELSNQVKGSTESIEFQNAAAKLARATNSSLTDSVNLLSSSLNAFGKDASSSEEVAGILFKTIEQGRVRAGELANTLGRVAPLANALGVEFNELGGAISRITQGGTKADTALTQVLGIFNKLSKPTPELAKAFKELGVATAQQGIQASGGLLPFLKDLQEVAGDSGTLVEFFNNVRAIQGVLSLLETDSAQTGKVFDALGISASEAGEVLNEAFNKATANDATRYDKAVQELAVTMREIGTSTLPLAVSGIKFFNSAVQGSVFVVNEIKDNIGLLSTAVVGYTIASGAATFAIKAMAAAFATLIRTMGPVGLGLTAVGLAAYGVQRAMNENTFKGFEEAARRSEEVLKDLNAQLNESDSLAKIQAQLFRESAAALTEYSRQFRDVRRDALSDVENLNRNFVAGAEVGLQALVNLRSQFANEIAKAVKNADKEILKSQERQQAFQLKKEDFLLKRSIKNLDENQKALKLFEASRKKAFDTKDLITGVSDLSSFDAAAKALEQRLALAKEGLAAADSSGNIGAIARAEEQVATALNDQINLEKQRSQIIEKRRQDAKRLQAQELAQTNQLKALTKDIRSELSLLNSSGQILNDQALEAQTRKVEGLIARLADFSLSEGQIDFGQALGIQNLASQFQQELTGLTTTLTVDREGALKDLRGTYDELNQFVDTNALQVAVNLDLVSRGADAFADQQEALGKAKKEFDNLTEAENRFNQAQLRVQASAENIRKIFEGTTGAEAFTSTVESTIEAIVTDANITLEQVQRFADALEERRTALFTPFKDDIGGKAQNDKQAIENLVTAFRFLQQARQNALEVGDDTAADRQRLESLKLFISAAESSAERYQKYIDKVDGAKDAQGQLNSVTIQGLNAVDATAERWRAVRKEIEASKRAAQGIGVPSRESFGLGRFNGGPIYRAAGGAARGQDKIPAMLSAGEFVMNSGSSRKFASQLVAMNAGANPTYRSEGGSISNTVNVGDINVNGTANPDDTARKVVSQLRREFRRGTASRFN